MTRNDTWPLRKTAITTRTRHTREKKIIRRRIYIFTGLVNNYCYGTFIQSRRVQQAVRIKSEAFAIFLFFPPFHHFLSLLLFQKKLDSLYSPRKKMVGVTLDAEPSENLIPRIIRLNCSTDRFLPRFIHYVSYVPLLVTNRSIDIFFFFLFFFIVIFLKIVKRTKFLFFLRNLEGINESRERFFSLNYERNNNGFNCEVLQFYRRMFTKMQNSTSKSGF